MALLKWNDGIPLGDNMFGLNSVWVNDCSAGGIYLYLVMRGHEVYDQIVSDKALTWSEQKDISNGYNEALEGYDNQGEL